MIDYLRLQNFRSYTGDSFEFTDGVNIVVGPNASGKTNLLEGILVASQGRSYRAQDPELLQHKAPWFRIDLGTSEGVRSVKVVKDKATGRLKKEFTLDDKPYKRLPLNKTLPVVVFEPNHLQLLSGSPERRRDYLDDLLSQTTPEYTTIRSQYKRVLAQRNALLKRGPNTKDQLFAWNIRLSELGGQIAGTRNELVSRINKELEPLYGQLASNHVKVSAKYESTCPPNTYASHLLHKLETDTELDYQRGFTAHGPHRDDMRVLLEGHPAEDVGSRGEIRTLTLGLKIVELQLLEESRGKKPLLLLDDVFSELDGARRKALTEFLSGYQTFITTTDADIVVQHFLDNCNIIAL